MHPSGEFRPPRWASIQRSPLVLVMLMGLCAATANGEPTTMTRQLPFALTSVTLYDHASDGVFSACFDRIQAILDRFNMYSSASEISQVNRTAAQKAVVVSDDFRDALGQALRLSQLTDGMFDPTVGPLVKLWKIGSDDAHVPSPQEIASALRLVGWKDVIFDEKARTVSFRRPGMALDFGAVLKGFSAVQAGQVLAAHGVKSAVVDIGGSVMTLGTHPDGSPWRIGIQKPGAPPGTSLGIVEVRDEVVNTTRT